MEKIAVLIPCYNEELTIGKVINDFKKELPEATIYVYDNNSSDNTAGVAAEHGAIVRTEVKQGKGNVIRSMFRDIDAECYLMIDGDDTYPAKNAREMCASVLDEDMDLVIGDRLSSTYFEENKRPFHGIGNKMVRFLINTIFDSEIRDVMTGYRAFSYKFVKTFPVLSEGFEIETEMTIHTLDKNLYVKNIIVDYQDRPDGSESKLNTYSDGYKVIMTICKLFKNYKPFAFFTTVSVFLTLIAAILMIPVLSVFFHTGLVPRFPTLIVAMFFLTAALLSFFTGLLLDNISKMDKRNFEMRLTDMQSKFEEMKKNANI